MSTANNQWASRENTPSFFAWCDETARVDAFAAALSALTRPYDVCSIDISSTSTGYVPVAKAAATLRAAFSEHSYASATYSVETSSRRLLEFGGHVCGDGQIRRGAAGPLEISPFDKVQLLPLRLPLPVGSGARSVEVEAAFSVLVIGEDVEDILLRLCAPDGSERVTMGVCTKRWHWGAPVELAATYHSEAWKVARDLALSWVHLHDKERMERAVGMSLDVLHGRVDAAPQGAQVLIAGGNTLSREAVLAALDAPHGALLDALEASAATPDDEWHAVEPLAIETIQAAAAGVPTFEVDLITRKHIRFIEQHAPYHVRRLPNGGVMLATHPYRTLWQLYADALFLLGIPTA